MLGLASLAATTLLLLLFRAWAAARAWRAHPDTSTTSRGWRRPFPPRFGEPEIVPRVPTAPFWFSAQRLIRPLLLWTAAALAALSLFAAFDWRGALANFADAATPLSRVEQRLPDKGRRSALRDRLWAAKQRTRRGEKSLQSYRGLLRELAGEAGAPPLTPEQVDQAFARFDAAP